MTSLSRKRKSKSVRLSDPGPLGMDSTQGTSLPTRQTAFDVARLDTAERAAPSGRVTKSDPSKQRTQAHVAGEPAWVRFSDEKLLQMRICDLGLEFNDTPLTEFRDQLYVELKARGLRLRPHCWLSDDWFSPDEVPGIALPFYMAHRRLMRLERNQMMEVEGGTKEWCMKIMRHEAGHAIDSAFRLHRRKGYRQQFGNYSDPYPESYRPRPRSKKFVLHLEPWYAQSHPAEDFAETFAVWLKPGVRWQKDYCGWPALNKLEYVDELMGKIAGQSPKVRSKAKVDPVKRITKTLGEHYAERHAQYNVHSPSVFDDDLMRLFSQVKLGRSGRTAAAFLQKHRAELGKAIAKWTGEYRYNINQVWREMVERCRLLKLYVVGDEDSIKQELMLLMTVHTMNYLHTRHRVAL